MSVIPRRLGDTLLFLLLFAVLAFQIIRSTVDLWQAPCPAYDGITHRGEHAAMGCPAE